MVQWAIKRSCGVTVDVDQYMRDNENFSESLISMRKTNTQWRAGTFLQDVGTHL